MGVDIHFYVEIKRKDGKWHFLYEGMDYSDSINLFNEQIGRNYPLFSFLTGTAIDEKSTPLDKPRGLPENLSNEVERIAKEFNEGIGGFNHTWYSLEELLNVDWKNQPFSEEIRTYLFTDILYCLGKYAKERELKRDEIRVIFWFDR